MTLVDIIVAIAHELVKDGDIFETSSGHRVIYRDGVLCWLTSGGYIGSAVTITDENIKETFNKVTNIKEKKISFTEALPMIAEGKEVKIVVGGRDYIIDSFIDLDDIIEEKEFFEDVYKADCFVQVEEKNEQSKSSNLTLPIVLDMAQLDEALVEVGKVFSNVGYSKKLTGADAYNIHHLYHFVKKPVKEIAEEYGVSERMIYYVLDGTHWQEVHEQFHKDYDVVTDDYVS
jgi:hypothetical protein